MTREEQAEKRRLRRLALKERYSQLTDAQLGELAAEIVRDRCQRVSRTATPLAKLAEYEGIYNEAQRRSEERRGDS